MLSYSQQNNLERRYGRNIRSTMPGGMGIINVTSSQEIACGQCRGLNQPGSDVRVVMDGRKVLTVQGIQATTMVEDLREKIFDLTAIHPSVQKLYIGGEEMVEGSKICAYFSLPGKILSDLRLRCHVTLLISSRGCPGSMLTSIAVRRHFDEPVAAVKRRIRDKFRIDVARQRLHVHPTEMTTYGRRRPLDDARLLSTYLAPYADGNFLELIVLPERKDDVSSEKQDSLERYVYLRLAAHSTAPLGENLDDEARQRNVDNWWYSVPLRLDKLIKRDPSVTDLIRNLEKLRTDRSLADVDKREKDGDDDVTLAYACTKPVHGGADLDAKKTIFGTYHVRDDEMLMMDVRARDAIDTPPRWLQREPKHNALLSVVSPEVLIPLSPLASYADAANRHSAPPEAFGFRWAVKAVPGTLDGGAHPGVAFEATAVSYARCYGSWDIPEHRKTYVEIALDGIVAVGDCGLRESLSRDGDNDFDGDKLVGGRISRDEPEDAERVVFYVLDKCEVTIFGPVNDDAAISLLGGDRTTPYHTAASVARLQDRRELYDERATARRGAWGNNVLLRPTPLRMRESEACVEPTSEIEDVVKASWDGRRSLSQVAVDRWCVTRERTVDATLPTTVGDRRRLSSPLRAFTTTCARGTSIDARPYVAVTYERRGDVATCVALPRTPVQDVLRTSFDARIQAQFAVCRATDDDRASSDPDQVQFKVRVHQQLTRVERVRDEPDRCTKHRSPAIGMEKILTVKLASDDWLKSIGRFPIEVCDLNQF